jgi:hypothetical protein
MLQKIERDPSLFIHRATISPSPIVPGGSRSQARAIFGNWFVKRFPRLEVPSPRPERYSVGIPPGKTAVAIELYFVEPFLAVRQLVDQSRIHGLDELDFGGRQRAEGFGCHEEC